MSERSSSVKQPVSDPLACWGFVVSIATLLLAPVAWAIFTYWAFQGLFEGWDDGRTSLAGPSNFQITLGLLALLFAVFAGLASGLLLSVAGLRRAGQIDSRAGGLALAGVIISSFGLGAFVLHGLFLVLS